MEKEPAPPIFVWRSELGVSEDLVLDLKKGFPRIRDPKCIYCFSPMSSQIISRFGSEADQRMLKEFESNPQQEEEIRRNYYAVRSRIEGDARKVPFNLGHAEERIERYAPPAKHPGRHICRACGWWVNHIMHQAHDEPTAIACLRQFRIDDENLAVDEIMSHLSKKYSDVYSLPPRRFEEVIGSVFRELGYTTELTKPTRDGGADIICLAKGSGEPVIVECKRYAESRKVGIGAIHRLVGARYDFGAGSAWLVTTSSFTQPARRSVENLNRQNLNLNLVDGHELLRLLKCYSNPTITVADIQTILCNAQRK